MLQQADRLIYIAPHEPGIADLPLACRPGIFRRAPYLCRHCQGTTCAQITTVSRDGAHTGRARKTRLAGDGWPARGFFNHHRSSIGERFMPCPPPKWPFWSDAAAGHANRASRSDTLIDALTRLRAQDLQRRNAQIGLDQRSA